MLPLLCIFKYEFDRLSDALERLLRFLWKWTKIISKFIGKYTVISAKWLWSKTRLAAAALAKLASNALDKLSDYICKKMKESEKRKKEKKSPESSEEDNNSSDKNIDETHLASDDSDISEEKEAGTND